MDCRIGKHYGLLNELTLRVYLYRKKYSTNGYWGRIVGVEKDVLMKHMSATNDYMWVPKVKDNDKTPWLKIYPSPRTST